MAQDFVIFGAGIAGLSTAYWLRELNPTSSILVIDKSALGKGASGKNAGFLTKGSAFFYRHLIARWGEEKALQVFQFSQASLSLLEERILLPSGVRFERSSSLTLYRDKKPELPESFHFFESESPFQNFSGALRSPGEFKITPLAFLNSFYELLLKKNISFEFGENRESQRGRKKTIYCLNAYMGTILPQFQDKISPRRAQMLRVRLENGEKIGPELFYDPEERVYFRSEGPSQLLIGGKRLVDAKNEETLMEGNSEKIQRALEDYLGALGLRFTVMDRWSGIMGFTESELPLLEDQGERMILGGFSGHGMGLGFHSGKIAAQMCLGDKRGLPF